MFLKLKYIILFLIFSIPLYSRDINLDKIYIEESCPVYLKIIDKKTDLYKNAGSGFIDKNIAFAEWLNGREIVYLKEQENTNIIYVYDIIKHNRFELARIDGTVTYFKASGSGKFIALKNFSIDSNANTEAQIVILGINPRKFIKIKSSYLFADFTISMTGQSIFIEKNSGIYEFFPDTEYENLIINRGLYENEKKGVSIILAYQSPDGNKFAILIGQAGSYKALFLGLSEKIIIEGISSSMEFFWIDNFNLAFRKGGPGSFRSIIYNIKKREEKIIAADSFNTGLNLSKNIKSFSFLKEQLINFYNIENGLTNHTGLEGEDSVLSPDSTRFISIYNRNLYLTNLSILEKKAQKIKKVSSEIAMFYNELLKVKKCWKNEFSYLYIKRKIAALKNFQDK